MNYYIFRTLRVLSLLLFKLPYLIVLLGQDHADAGAAGRHVFRRNVAAVGLHERTDNG